MTNTTNSRAPDPILYANSDSILRKPPTILVTSKPTGLYTIPHISAESTKPLHVAVMSMSDTLTKLLNLWTTYSTIDGKQESLDAYSALDAEFSTIRTAYLKAKAQAERT
jgi:hypothetical protein